MHLQLQRRPAAVIFDMDGTLIDSETFWRKAEVAVFNSLGVPLTEDECAQTVGVRIDKVVEYWFERRPWHGATHAQVVSRIVDEVARLFLCEGVARENAVDCVKMLTDLGIPLAVASASPERLIQSNMLALGLEDAFTVIHSAEFEVAGKPHPAVYLTTARKLKVNPVDCIAVEDSLHGINSAKAAGKFCIAIEEPSTPFDVAQQQADLGIRSFKELMAMIDLKAWNY